MSLAKAFTDTGLHKLRTLLGSRLNDAVTHVVEGVDAVLHLVDAPVGVGRGDAFVYARQVAPVGGARICVVNKVDQLRHHDVALQLAAATELGAYDEIVPASARDGEGVHELREIVIARMPEGPAFNSVETVTHLPIEVRLSELVREQALRVTRDEVPHSTAVVLDGVEPEDGLTRSGSAIPRRWTAWGL